MKVKVRISLGESERDREREWERESAREQESKTNIERKWGRGNSKSRMNILERRKPEEVSEKCGQRKAEKDKLTDLFDIDG